MRHPALTLLPLLLGAIAAAQTPLATTLTPTPCRFGTPLPTLTGHTLSCADLTVPAQHEQPGGKTYRLHVAIYRAAGLRQADPLIVLNGGPGQRTTSLAPALPLIGTLAAQRDLILFDQRGVGASTPALRCELPAEYLTLENTVNSSAQGRDLLTRTVQDCFQKQVQAGTNLASFNTQQSADDVALLARVVTGGTVNLYSASYGTRLAQEVMRRHPEVLRSVILDAPVSTDANYLQNRGRTIDQAYRLALHRCTQDRACNAAFPKLAERVETFAVKLEKTPLKVEVDLPSGKQVIPLDATALGGMTSLLLYSTGAVPVLPWFLDAILKGDTSDLKNMLPATLAVLNMNEIGMQFAFGCNDVIPYAKAGDLEYGAGQPSALLKGLNDQANFAVYSTACQGLPFKALPASARQPVSSRVPTLILSGELDPVTPPPYARAIAQHLRSSQLVVFPDGAHGQLGMPCGMKLMTAFLDKPGAPLNAACAATSRPFALPKP